jgi:predicted transcriptional regulator
MMLGVRLDAEMDRRLTAIARRQRRSKSDVARQALASYLQQEDDRAEFARQVRAIAEWEAQNEDDTDAFLNALVAEALDDLDREEAAVEENPGKPVGWRAA